LGIITTTRVFLTLALSVTLSFAGTSGQKRSAKKKVRHVSTSSPATEKLRARRVITEAPSDPAPSTSNQTPALESANENSLKPPIAKTQAGGEPVEPTEAKEGLDISDKKVSERGALPPAAETKSPKPFPDTVTSLRAQIEATPSGSERIRLQLKLSEQLIATGKKIEAIEELRAITKTEVFDPQGLYNAGNAFARLGDSEDAINAYHKAIDQRKGNYSRALNNLGVILLREGRWDEAHDALLSALKLESFRYAEASYNLGRLYSARGESDMATREWRRTLRIDPEHKAAAQALSLGASEAGIVVSSKPSERLERSGKRPSPPNPERTKVLELDAISYDFLQRARNLSELGKHREAIENYQRVLSRLHGYFPPANLELSYALLALNRTDEAFANLLQVANRDGARYPMTYYNLARLYELKGNLTEAEELFAKAAMPYKTKNISFLLDLSRVRERRGNFKGALAALEEYLTTMEHQGLKPSWSDQALTALREKASNEPK
jgi:tetratricopeptide (TPR) repeat protein